jgi:hypothetical protein
MLSGRAAKATTSAPLPPLDQIGRNAIKEPINGVAVTDAVYGAVDDGLKGYFTATWVVAASTLTVAMASLSVTVANTGTYNGATVAQVTFPGLTSGMGINLGSEWIGKPIAITGAGAAGGTLVAKVVGFFYDSVNANVATAILNIPAPTPITASTQSLACPCFTSGSDGSGVPSCVGAAIWISNGAAPATTGSIQKSTALRDTIASVVSPFQITIAGTFTAPSVTAIPGSLIVWGKNNSAAVIAAGRAAIGFGRKTLFFPGFSFANSTGLFCCFDFVTNAGLAVNLANYLASETLSALHWISSDAETFVSSATGANGNTATGFFQDTNYKKSAVPFNAPGLPVPKIGIQGAMHMPRCATLNSIVVVVTGDSWGTPDPSGTGGNDHYSLLCAELQRQNPGKTIHIVNRAISGATYQWLNSVPNPAAFPPWYAVHSNPWLSYIQTVPVDGLGTVTPDLVIIYMTGNNEGSNAGQMYKNDVASTIATIKGWPQTNGLPPDIVMIAGGSKGTENFTNGSSEAVHLTHEYCTSFLRSFARVNGIGLMDFGTYGGMLVDGWSPDAMILKQVPSLAAGVATATAPYSCQYLTRDFFFAVQLGTAAQTGTSFWAAAGTLSISLAAKPDNRLWIGPDGSGNLVVAAVTWGLPVTTPCAITNGAGALVTSGQTSLTPTAQFIAPAPPSFKIGNNAASFTSGMVGQCFLIPTSLYNNADMRSYVSGYTNSNNAYVSDGNGNGGSTGSIFVGGQMFVANDATAKADIILAGAGATNHLLTGANSLVTKVATYTSKNSVGLAANASATLTAGSPVKVFVGSIAVGPTYDTAMQIATDAGANPIYTIQKRGNHLRIGYVPGGSVIANNVRAAIQNNEIVVWEGDVECYGGPYIPQIWAGASVTVQVVYAWLGERDLRLPSNTEREIWGAGDAATTFDYGGDTSHLSQIGISRIVDPIMARQNWAAGANYAGTFAVNVPTTGFSYTIPANQAFTQLTPAGTLASGTITLPAVSPQGGRIEIMSTQTITSLTVSAPSGYTIQGAAVTTLAANGTLAYRLAGTVFCRVQ